jgi:hypothetical protein
MADVVVPSVQWHCDPAHDARDGAEWTDGEVEELAFILQEGGTIDEAAELLCRQGTKDDVRRKAEEMRLI